MSETYNIYCDESCHLERDGAAYMALGAVWCKADQAKPISDRLRDLKETFGLFKRAQIAQGAGNVFETKWTKVSASKVRFYLAVVDYFFDDDDLHFRTVLINKKSLDHPLHNQTHDEWYYKMMFLLLEPIIQPQERYCIYLDIKDTRSEPKRAKLLQVLRSSRRDGVGQIISRVQQMRSHESELMQVADLLMGAVVFHNRLSDGQLHESTANVGKKEVVRRIQRRSHKSLLCSTWLREDKFNIFRWEPKGST